MPQSAVKVNNVAVGQVDDIKLGRGGKYADRQLEINGDVRCRRTRAPSIEQTSLLGEKFVALTPVPPTRRPGTLETARRSR